MSNKQLSIVQSENVRMIVNGTPQTYDENQLSHDRCIDAGSQLLASIQAHGMTDELDQQAAVFIEKARKTVAKMNERRSPLTKLFDSIRREFTVLESDIDPKTAGSVPYQLQLLRNKYAAAKREEEERRRREELAAQQQRQAREKFMLDVAENYRSQFNALLDSQVAALMMVNSSVTLQNYDEVMGKIKAMPVDLPQDFALKHTVSIPYIISRDEACEIADKVLKDELPKFREQYRFEMSGNRDTLLNMLPGKRAELEKAAQASAEEAERIRREIAQREAQEAARKEAERKQREEKERQEAEMRQRNAEMGGLFDQASIVAPQYQPKTSVRKKIVPLCPAAFSDIIMFWWVNEGQHLSVEELSKVCKKMLTYAERAANDKTNPVQIKCDAVRYEDDVKAK